MSGRERLIIGGVALALLVAAFALSLHRFGFQSEAPGASSPQPSQSVVAEGAETVIHYLLSTGRIAKTEVGRAGADLVGKSMGEIQALRPEWRIVSFAPHRIVASKPCPEAVGPGGFLRATDGFVGIYLGEPDGCHRLLEMLPIPLSSLSSMAQEQLQEGVRFRDEQDLPQVLDGLRTSS